MGRYDREYTRRTNRPSSGMIRALCVILAVIIFIPFRQMWFADYASFDLLDTYGKYSGLAITSVQAAIQSRNEFPRLIWQTDAELFNAPYAEQKDSWKRLNPEYQYEILLDSELDTFVSTHFAHSPSLLTFWSSLTHPTARSNLIRYLLLLSHGGIYSTIDSTCATPISTWLPSKYRHARKIRALLGLAYNQNSDPQFARPNAFSQWTMAAEPGHPIFEAVVERVMSNVEFIARMQQVPLEEVELSDAEVLEATGSGAFTDAVLEVLQDVTGDATLDISRFDGMMLPTLFGDVLVMPVNAFAAGQKWDESNAEFGEVLASKEFDVDVGGRRQEEVEMMNENVPEYLLDTTGAIVSELEDGVDVEEGALPPGAERRI